MKIPRDVSAAELMKRIKILGYEVTRQTGSHLRLTTEMQGQHHITIPNHNPIKIGTLSTIIGEIAEHFKKPKEEILSLLFE